MLEAASINKAEEKIIAIAGNPNSGKTSIFNNLTGGQQHVGNWPGVTVEKKEGRLKYKGKNYNLVDLPGIYSLGAFSEDEVVARDFLLREKPDVVINVVDATNLLRNLYLTVQLLEMGIKVVLALNMIDEARARDIDIDIQKLAESLGVTVIPTVATREEGIKELVTSTVQAASSEKESNWKLNYGKDVESEIQKLQPLLKKHTGVLSQFPGRWTAVKLLEEDEDIASQLKENGMYSIIEQQKLSLQYLKDITGEEGEQLIASRRYGYINGVVKQAVTRHFSMQKKLSISDKIDYVVTNRITGIPLFLLSMWAVFQFTFTLGEPIAGWIESFFARTGAALEAGLTAVNAPGLAISFAVDGIIGGIGSVLVFAPNIFLLFLAISFLEDSGYMARAAYIMERFMHSLGLHGKSFIPLVIGFGCNVPAIMAARTLDDRRDRLLTILITPFMSCGARLPVYVLFVSAFFSRHQGMLIFSLYLAGIIIAVITGKFFKNVFFAGETSPFVMELPPYRVPTWKGTFLHMWVRGREFFKRAGTIIFVVVILIWFLSVFPYGVDYAGKQSFIGILGSSLAPLFAPCGFGSWEAATALISGIMAKEVVVGTLGVLYGAQGGGLIEIIRQNWTPLSAYAFMLMTLLYIPCAAVIATIKKETGTWKWPAFTVGYTFALGWLAAFIVYQGGRLLGLE